MKTILLHNKNILLVALATVLILLIPLVAMQFTEEVNWSPMDFTTMGALLFGAGLAFVLLTRKAGSLIYRAAVAAALGTAFLLIWVNLAVGIIGSESNPANLMYLGVLAVLVTGFWIARFRPRGMARALFATALAQVLVTVIALVVLRDPAVLQLVLINGFFAALWAGSGLLFRRVRP